MLKFFSAMSAVIMLAVSTEAFANVDLQETVFSNGDSSGPTLSSEVNQPVSMPGSKNIPGSIVVNGGPSAVISLQTQNGTELEHNPADYQF